MILQRKYVFKSVRVEGIKSVKCLTLSIYYEQSLCCYYNFLSIRICSLCTPLLCCLTVAWPPGQMTIRSGSGTWAAGPVTGCLRDIHG